MGFFDFMTEDIAIDLGTANTLIIHKGKVVIDSPSIVAMDRSTKKIIAIGKKANMMQGKTHENIKTIRPLKDGVIADFEASEQMIREFIKNIPTIKKRFFRPSLRMVICIPSGITEVEKRAVRDSAEQMNAKEIYLIQQLEGIITKVVDAVRKVHVANVNLLDNGEGTSLPAYVSAYPAIVTAVLKELREATGIDVPEVLTDRSVKKTGGLGMKG